MPETSLRQIFDNRKLNGAIISKASDAYRVDPRLFKVDPSYNTRDYSDPDVQAHVDNLVNVIKQGGDLGVFTVAVKEGGLWLRDGHCRNLAIVKALSLNVEVRPVLVREIDKDLEEGCSEAIILTSNNGLKLKPLERASTYARILAKGRTVRYIAELEGISEVAVRNHLKLHKLPDDVKHYIKTGKLSFTSALDLHKEHGERLASFLSQLEEKEEGGEDSTAGADTEEQVTIFDAIGSVAAPTPTGTPSTSDREDHDWDLLGTPEVAPVSVVDLATPKKEAITSNPKTAQPKKPAPRLTGKDFGVKTIKGEQAKVVTQVLSSLSSKIEEAAAEEMADPDSVTLTLDKELAESIIQLAKRIRG